MLARRPFRRRALSMTSLIDVIFLLLMFFMLSSTFARYGELAFAAGAQGAGTAEVPPLFLRLGPGALTLNGAPASTATLVDDIVRRAPEGGPVIVALAGEVSSQALVDVLAILARVPGAEVTVIE